MSEGPFAQLRITSMVGLRRLKCEVMVGGRVVGELPISGYTVTEMSVDRPPSITVSVPGRDVDVVTFDPEIKR